MTRGEALELVRHYWGRWEVVPASVVQRIEKVAQPGESLLATLARVGEVPEVLDIPPFNHAAVRQLVAYAELRR